MKKMYQNAIFVRIFDITKIAHFWWKSADFDRPQGLCQVIYTLFGSSLGDL